MPQRGLGWTKTKPDGFKHQSNLALGCLRYVRRQNDTGVNGNSATVLAHRLLGIILDPCHIQMTCWLKWLFWALSKVTYSVDQPGKPLMTVCWL